MITHTFAIYVNPKIEIVISWEWNLAFENGKKYMKIQVEL